MSNIGQPTQRETAGRKGESSLLTRIVNCLQEDNAKKLPSLEGTSQLFLTQNRVVGREKQLRLLEDVYQRISEGQSEVVTIHGPSGAGKSTLLEVFVRELPPRVFCVNGKFDQLQSHAPYAALVSASDQLCRQVLQRSNCNDIRDRLRLLLGPEINLLGSLIPTIAKMTANTEDGDATNKGHMGGQGFTRFKLLFRAFFRCVASHENPIILFLDDIQWADSASLEVLRAITTDNLSKHMMIIGAYRDGKMPEAVLQRYNLSSQSKGSDDSITELSSVASLSNHRAKVTDIAVTGLDVTSLNDLISSVLEMEKSKTLSLGKLVLNKTDGNAFYVLNFLDMLLSKCLVSRVEGGSWTWDEHQILQSTNVSDNLAAILETKLRKLPEQLCSILQIASFVGHSFTTEVLVTIVHEEQDMIQTEYSFEKHSRELMYDQIITTLEVALSEGLLETTNETDEYKFSHDKIQQCLYRDLMPDHVERGLLHQRIGSLIWTSVKNSEESDFDDRVFLAAENLNRALDVVDYSESRYELIEVNLRAAKLAKERSAFIVAAEYLRTAVGLLEGDVSWEDHYELCLDLYFTSAEAEKNAGCYGRCSELVGEIHKRAKSFQRQVEAYVIEVQSLAVQGDPRGSILLGLDVLRKMDVKFSKKINTLAVLKELILAKVAIGTRPLEVLQELPEMTDWKKLLSLNLMNIVAINAFVVGDSYKEIFVAVCLRMVRLTLKYGLSALHSPVAFSGWGTVHAILGQYDVCIKAEKLALNIVDKFNVESVRGRTLIMNYASCHLWRHPLDHDSRHQFLHAYHLAMSFGDISFGYYGYVSWVQAGFYLDAPLGDMHRRTQAVVAEGREYESCTLLMFLLPLWQILLNLSGDSENPDPSWLLGEAFDDSFALEVKTINSNMSRFSVHLCELILGYFYENWEFVQNSLPFLRNNEKEFEGYFSMGFNLCWSVFSYYDLYRATGKRKYRKEGRRAHRIVRNLANGGTVMLSGPSKFLAAMESLCVKNVPMDEVEIQFQEAFAALAASRCRVFEALANERLARLFLTECMDPDKGYAYLERAVDLYRRWGAVAKADWLENRYSRSTIFTKGTLALPGGETLLSSHTL